MVVRSRAVVPAPSCVRTFTTLVCAENPVRECPYIRESRTRKTVEWFISRGVCEICISTYRLGTSAVLKLSDVIISDESAILPSR